jgi:hypothetical protein
MSMGQIIADLRAFVSAAPSVSAQESKPEHLELSEVVYAAGDTDDAFIWPVDWGDPVECEGFVILRGDPKLREWIKLMLDHARQNMADAVAFIRSQDASPKDGWRPLSSLPADGKVLASTVMGEVLIVQVSVVRYLMKIEEIEKDHCYYTAWQPAILPAAPEPHHD